MASRPATTDRWRSRRRVGAALVAAVIGTTSLVAVLGASPGDLRSWVRRGAADVALPDGTAVPAGRGLTGEARRAALAPFDPDRPRCEPEGCEVWHRPAVYVTTIADLLVAIEGDQLVALDPVTGEPRWQQPLTVDGDVVGVGAHLAVADTAGGLTFLDQDGQPVWARSSSEDGGTGWQLQADVGLLIGSRPVPKGYTDRVEVVAFDLADGSRRWTATVSEVGELVAGYVRVWAPGEVRAIDTSTGAFLSALPDDVEPVERPAAELSGQAIEDGEPRPGSGTVVRPHPRAGDPLTLHLPGGAEVTVRPDGWLVHGDPPVVATERGLIGVRAAPGG